MNSKPLLRKCNNSVKQHNVKVFARCDCYCSKTQDFKNVYRRNERSFC